MADLIACLSSGKGTWGHVNRLINDSEWGRIYLVTNDFGKENFNSEKEAEFIVVDFRQGILELRDAVCAILKDKELSGDVGLNIISGAGKEHTALISALLKLGVGIRFIALTKNGVEEI